MMTTQDSVQNTPESTVDPDKYGEESVLGTLLYTNKGNALLALGGMYTVSMGFGFTLLYILVALPIAVGIISIYTVFLFVYIWMRAPSQQTRRVSYVLFIGIPYVFAAIGIIVYGLFM